MTKFTRVIIAAAAMASFAACAHRGYEIGAAGDIAVDSLSASRTVILRIQNDYPAEVRVYRLIDGRASYLDKAMPGTVATHVLDPNQFPTIDVRFEARAADGSGSKILGPYELQKGQTVDIVVPRDLARTHAMIHASTD